MTAVPYSEPLCFFCGCDTCCPTRCDMRMPTRVHRGELVWVCTRCLDRVMP